MTKTEQTQEKVEALRDCVRRVAESRDKQAFEVLFNHYAPLIRSYSLAREPGASLLADELAQDVMTKLWFKAEAYNSKLANLNTWIFTLARNCRIDHLRRNNRLITNIDPGDIFCELEDLSPGPFQLAQNHHLEQNIHDGIKKLPQEQAQVLTKVYLQGKSHQQACEELKLPLGTVKSRIRLALKKLEIIVKR